MNISQERSKLLEERMLNFAVSVVLVTKKLSSSRENIIITDQVIRSAMSIGANYAEANNASSKADFRNKIVISKKEAAETRYWLRVIPKLNPEVNVDKEIDEVTQLLLILQEITNTLRNAK